MVNARGLKYDLYFKIKQLTGVAEGSELPGWFRGIRAVFFPVETISLMLSSAASGPIHYRPSNDTVEIFGKRYTLELFHSWSDNGMLTGTLFRIEQQKNTEHFIIHKVSPYISVDTNQQATHSYDERRVS